MAVTVLVPTVLQRFTNEQAVLQCSASNISELFDSLEEIYPAIKGRLRKPEGEPLRFLNFYVNSEDIRFLQNTGTPLEDGDEVSIVPAVAGG
mgnify:CR=1 FL=1